MEVIYLMLNKILWDKFNIAYFTEYILLEVYVNE